MRAIKTFSLCVLTGVLLGSTSSILPAQSSLATPRITADVDESSLTTLKGNVPSMARAEYDQGEAARSMQMTHVRLVLARSSAQQMALDAYQAQLQDKSSPNYHKWLTPQQFGQLYGPADADIAVLVTWLQSHGLTLEAVSAGRTTIAFSGTVAQVEEAFHTSIHSFRTEDRQFYSNTADPQIPSALAAVVKGVTHLNTIQPKPHFTRGNSGKFNVQTRRLEAAHGLTPDLTETSPDFLYMVPGDAATIYDTPNTFNANYSSGTSYTGAGVKIGIGGAATITASIAAAYRTMFLGNSTAPILNYCTTPTTCSNTPSGTYDNTDDQDEAYLDVELAGGLAPGATIYYYASTDLVTGIEAAIDANLVDIFSLSFGGCESEQGTGGNAEIKGWWEQAAAQGIAVTVSTGDSGSAGCDNTSTSSGKNVTAAIGGLAVSGFSTTPYNIAVGGTDLYALNSSFTTYVNTANEGTSSNNYNYFRTAKSSIPESTWNDSTNPNLLVSENVASTSTSNCAGGGNIVAGSGGASSCATGSGSSCAGYSKPIWQTGTISDGVRDVPDVSLMAGNGCDSATWLVCTGDTGTYNGQTVTMDCETQSDGYFFFAGFGGTSTATPAFAGILALVQQNTGSRLGQAAQTLYELSNGGYSGSIFRDVTVGNDSVPCTSSSPNCTDDTAGYFFETGYNTTTGYDLATGLGSVDATQLITYWNTSNGTASATVNLTSVAPNPVTTIQPLTVIVSVTGASGTPTGTLTLTVGGYTSIEPVTSGGYTFIIPAGSIAIGSDKLTVSYSGSTTYAKATASTTVTVNGLTATVTANPSLATINTTQAVTVTGAVTGSGGTPTGTVRLTGGGYTSATTTLSGTGTYSITIPAGSLAIGTDTLTVTYNGSTTYTAATTSTTVTVNGLTAVVTANSSATSINSNQTVTISGTVTGAGGTPTGTVTLTGGGYTSAATTLSGIGAYSIIIPLNSLSAGSDMLTVTYNGSTVYAPGSFATTTVTVTFIAVVTPTVTVTPASSNADASQSLSVTVKVSGTSSGETSPTGTVTLTSGSYSSGAVLLSSCTAASCVIVIPAKSLNAGSDTLTGTYSGDAYYSSAVGTGTVTIAATSTLVITATQPSASIAPGGTATSNIVVSSDTSYTGTVMLNCALTNYPSGALDLPSCSVNSTSVSLSSGVPMPTTVIATISTTAAAASLVSPKLPGKGRGIFGAGGSAVLALLLFLGIPARRRGWRKMLGALVLMAAFGVLSGCGSNVSKTSNQGTSADTYTFTVTATGMPAVNPAPTATFTVTVN